MGYHTRSIEKEAEAQRAKQLPQSTEGGSWPDAGFPGLNPYLGCLLKQVETALGRVVSETLYTAQDGWPPVPTPWPPSGAQEE